MAPDDLTHLERFSFRPPTITFSEQLSFYIGEHSFQLINFPGHTPFQTAVYIPEERTVFTSDNVIGEGNAFFPPEALPFKWLDSLKKMQKLDADVFIPGHGSVCKKDYIPEMIAQIQDRIDTVKAAINQGMSLEEAGPYTAGVIAGLRAGEEGQEGVTSFLERRKPSWSILPDDNGD